MLIEEMSESTEMMKAAPGQSVGVEMPAKKIRKRKKHAGTRLQSLPNDPWFVRFQKARLRAGLTQRELSQLIGVSHTAVCYWERGSSFPTARKFDIIETILNDTLFERSEVSFKPSRSPDHVTLMRVFMNLSKIDQERVLNLACQLVGDRSDEVGDDKATIGSSTRPRKSSIKTS